MLLNIRVNTSFEERTTRNESNGTLFSIAMMRSYFAFLLLGSLGMCNVGCAEPTELDMYLMTNVSTIPPNELNTNMTDATTQVTPIGTTLNLPPSSPGCPNGWNLLHDMCYTLLGYGDGKQLNFRDAESACQQNAMQYNGTNGHLASIPYDGINALVTSFMKIVPQDVWIGLWSNSSGELTWIDTGLGYTYENFAREEPSLNLTTDVCIKLLNDPESPGHWVSVLCNDKAAYMCQMSPQLTWDPNEPVVSLCGDPDYQSYFSSCYKFVKENNTFADAKEACEAEGATLASFTDRYELAFGETMLHFHQIENTWIGLERDQNGQYKWLDGWPLAYTQWDHNEPTENGCVALGHNGWVDLDCNQMHPYFCKTSEESAPDPEPISPGYCLDNWLKWNNSCYLFPDNIEPTEWDSANYACQSQYDGSILASVHSDEEGLFLRTQSTLAWGGAYAFWIGLELAEDGYYDWKDGTLFDYQNWRLCDGEPSIIWPLHGRGCGFIPADSTEWYDEECYDTAFRFVCKTTTRNTLPTPILTTKVAGNTTPKQTTLPTPPSESTTAELPTPAALTAGEIVAIVICFIIVAVVVAVIVYAYLRNSRKSADLTRGPIDGGENAVSVSDGQSIVNKVYDGGQEESGEEDQL